MTDGIFQDLNEIFHIKARLGIMTLLASLGESDFTTLKNELGLTDGNLGAHLRVLENAEYLVIEKGFVGRRPHTVCRLTESGREAFLNYLKQLEEVIQIVKNKESFNQKSQ